MRRRLLFVTALAMTLVAALATLADRPAQAAFPGSPPPPPQGPPPILYDQFDSQGTGAALSQDFEPALDDFDSETADDFVVPAGEEWTISEVDFFGALIGAVPPTSIHVRFYLNGQVTCQAVLAERLYRPTSGGQP